MSCGLFIGWWRYAGQRSCTAQGALRWLAAGLAFCLPIASSAQGNGTPTPAGTIISNVARAVATLPSGEVTVTSNTDTRLVAERLDVGATLTAASDGAIAFTLANGGNGREAFALAATVPAGVQAQGFAIDRDGDGRWGAVDTRLEAGQTPVLASGERLALLLVLTGAPAAGADVTITARALTGAGMPGTAFDHAGDGGGDAVVGPTGALARLVVPLAPVGTPALVKGQTVRDPAGGTGAVPGAVVTYTLDATFPAAAEAAAIDDPVPAGSRYVPGSLTLDGTPLPDPPPDVAGAAAIHVALGDVPAGAARRVTFQAILQ